MKYTALLSSSVHFPTASTRPTWLVRQNPVKSAVPNFVTPKGPAAPNDALHDAGNATSFPRVTSRRQSVGSSVPITFVTPATRTSSASMPASSHVQLATSATTVPLSAGRVAFITVANAAARRRTPCAEPCPWSCPHQSCPLPCGSVRLIYCMHSPLQLPISL